MSAVVPLASAPSSTSRLGWRWNDTALLGSGALLLGVGGFLGLAVAPTEEFMGDVYRIMFVHVPSAWMSLLAATVNFGASLWYLLRSNDKADAVAEASAEVSVVFGAFLLLTGMIWAYPTWGVFWTWDPRLTSAAIMFFAYAGYIALRNFVADRPERRASWAAVMGILIYAVIPLVWFSVKWWNSLHQVQSTPRTLAPDMTLALRVNAFAFLALMSFFIRQRYLLARQRAEHDSNAPPPLDPSREGAV